MKLKTFYPRHVLVNLILPFNLVIGLVLLIAQISIMYRTVDRDGLVARQFIHGPLLSIMEKDEDRKSPIWLGLVAMESGKIEYFADTRRLSKFILETPPLIDRNSFDWDNPTREELDFLLASVVKKIPEQVTILSFEYKGQNGMAIYLHDLLPLHMRVLQRPVYIGVVFAMTLILFFLGVLQMNSHQRSVRSLIRSSERIKNRDLDTKIEVTHRTDMQQVFEAFDQMRRGLKANRDRESRFIMSVTHDLKTPLSAMRMYLEAMNDGYIEVSGEAKEAVEKILAKSSVLESRISGLLEYMRLQSTAQEMDRESIPVSRWLKEQGDLFEEECRLNDRNFQWDVSVDSQVIIRGNEEMLNRALQNLIDNGCRYTGSGQSLFLRAKKEEDHLELVIEDNGPGIDESEREKIFELFYRADKGRNSRGMGIGLASVKAIIESHGGIVFCTDSRQGGAAFVMRLPLG